MTIKHNRTDLVTGLKALKIRFIADSSLQLGFMLDAGSSNITYLPSYGLAVPESLALNAMRLRRFPRLSVGIEAIAKH